ncbi:MAG: toluene monooxygenase [Deltaproteobacteria bacterium]|nr:toluene monooxygenase [Deltaproteobacteria bacterium]
MGDGPERWLELARKLDWTPKYAAERDLFPPDVAGAPWLESMEWASWEEPFRTTYAQYVSGQRKKEGAVRAIFEALGRPGQVASFDRAWVSSLKLHSALLALGEFGAVVGNLRAARFGRASAWRTAALLGALDECRHTQIPLRLAHGLVDDPQFDWTHRLFHTNNWISIAARHFFDELLVTSNPIELAIGTNFVFETGFTNLQFIGLAAVARGVNDTLLERVLTSIQTDEARHAQIGRQVLEVVARHDPAYAQFLVDKWWWRSWLLFAVLTGFTMDYLAPVSQRKSSFKEFIHEWLLVQFDRTLEECGLARPWYWDEFIRATSYYHHMVYATAYTYRATVWFDLPLPGPADRAWLASKYPESWAELDPIWDQISARWEDADPGIDFAVHGTAIVGFCELCQLVLSNGTPTRNSAVTASIGGQKYVFCSEPCRRIFEAEESRYSEHKGLVKRVLDGEAPGNLMALLTQYCGLVFDDWGKDAAGGVYSWLTRTPR